MADKFDLYTDDNGDLYLSKNGFVVEGFNRGKGCWAEISRPYVKLPYCNSVSFERMLSMTSGVKPKRLQ